MPKLVPNQYTNVILQIGDILSVDGFGSVVRYVIPQGGDLYPPVVITGPVIFGPYDVISAFRLVSTNGELNYIQSSVITTNENSYSPVYRKLVTENQTTTIFVPSGSNLTITGDGFGSIVELISNVPQTPIAYDGVTKSITATNYLRVFRVSVIFSVVLLQTGWASNVPRAGYAFVTTTDASGNRVTVTTTDASGNRVPVVTRISI